MLTYFLILTDVYFLKLVLRTFDVVRQLPPCHARRVRKTRQRGNEKALKSEVLEFVNPNGAKMVDVCVWNLKKHRGAWNEMEVGKLRDRAV